jgi:hypothetical protein
MIRKRLATRTFGKYEVRVWTDFKVDILYVWSARNKEMFLEGATTYGALCALCRNYLSSHSNEWYEASAFMLKIMRHEFA